MSKDLPKMYQKKIIKPISSVQQVYSSINKNEKSNNNIGDRNGERYSGISIDKKIDNIFNSYDYVYKADVIIVTDTGNMSKRVVGRNKNNLITIDNEYIPINIIRDIYK